MEIKKLQQKFTKHILDTRGASEQTARNYLTYLNRFCEIMGISQVNEITEKSIENFKEKCKSR